MEIHCKGVLDGLIITVDTAVPYYKVQDALGEDPTREQLISALCAVILEWDFLHEGEPVPLNADAFDLYLPAKSEQALLYAINAALFEGYDPLTDSSESEEDPSA